MVIIVINSGNESLQQWQQVRRDLITDYGAAVGASPPQHKGSGVKTDYDAGHIPGARFITLNDISVSDTTSESGLTLQMPAPDDLRTKLEALGISDASRIVVSYGRDRIAAATRVLYTLDYAGLSNVTWLDGGIKAWKDYGRALSTTVPDTKAGTLSPLKIRPIVVDHTFVQAHAKKPGFAVVDARDRAFYDGIPGRDGGPAKPGHIPGAVSAPYNLFATGDTANGGTTLKSPGPLPRLPHASRNLPSLSNLATRVPL